MFRDRRFFKMFARRCWFCSTPPPFRADEKRPGVFLSAGIPAAFRRRAPTVPVARCGITNLAGRRAVNPMRLCRLVCG